MSVHLSAHGQSVLSAYGLGADVLDLEANASGQIAATGEFGLALLSGSGATLDAHHADASSPTRCAETPENVTFSCDPLASGGHLAAQERK